MVSTDVSAPAAATPWESEDIQLARVRQFVVSDIVAAIGGLVMLAVFWFVWQPDWIWVVAAPVLFSLSVLTYSLHMLRQRRLSAAVVAVAASFWLVMPAITFVLPPSFGACALATIWPVLLATPYVDRATLRFLAYVTFPVSLLSLAFSLRGDPFGVEETLGTTVMNLCLVGIGITFALLTLIMIWAYNSRLQDTLAGLHESNARLAANERQLEEKVAARTDELESASAYLRAVIENLPQGLVTLNGDGVVLERNAAFVDQFALDATEISLSEFPEPLQELVAGLSSPATNAAEPTSEEPTFVSLTRDRVGKASGTRITVAGGGTQDNIGAVVLVDDVTAERQIDRMKTDFISTVSHELRTPLTSVLGFARIIQRRLDERVFPNVDTNQRGVERAMRQVESNLDIILDEGGRLTNLINDVLDISKMEARHVEWAFEPTSLTDVVDQAVSATDALFADSPVSVVVDLDPDLPLVSGDRERLVQVVINLLSNAHKFTESGHVAISTSRAMASDNATASDVVLSVSDTGIGVAEADLPLLFERFRQVGDSLTDRPAGTGLGLPICREIIDAHGGTIDASSQLGVGTTFTVRLPSVEAAGRVETSHRFSAGRNSDDDASKLLELFSQQPLVADERPRAIDPENDGRPHVLVVDDDEGIRRLLRDIFQTEGYRVSEATSGEAAVHLASNERPDLITLDVLMPGMSGIDTAIALRTSASTATVPLVFISVLDRIPGPSLGVEAHVTKPIDTDQLLTLAAKLVTRAKPSSEDVVVVNASAAVLTTIVDGLERFGYERADGAATLHGSSASPDGVRLVIANSSTDAGYPEINRWVFRRGNDELVVIAFETENKSKHNRAEELHE